MLLDPHSQAILEEYRTDLPFFKEKSEELTRKVRDFLASAGIIVAAIESRVKTEASLCGKLDLKGNKYSSLADITDIIGMRVITFYIDDVDKVASALERLFDVDWENSVDKRKVHEIDSFGYLSLHYICRIPDSRYRFEVQMRTVLQHAWANMNHDTGYKSGVEVPREYLRNLNRLAGMLELVDEQFSQIRMDLTDYRRRVRALVASGNLDEVPLDGDTFKSFLALHPFDQLNRRIASVNQAEIHEQSIGLTDLDIISSTIGPQDLCIAYILIQGGGKAGIKYLFDLLNGPAPSNESMAEMLVEQAGNLPFMNQ